MNLYEQFIRLYWLHTVISCNVSRWKLGKIEFDLTLGKSMYHNRRESNDNSFMALLNFLADPTVIVDEKGVFLAVNDAVENLTGLSKKEFVGKNFLEIKNLTPENKILLLENFKKRMQSLHIEPYEISLIDKDEQTRYFELKAKKIDYAGQPADVAILRDITRRKENARRLKEYAEKMEELVNAKVKEIKESEEKYRELINKMNENVWVIDFDGKFIDVNDAAVKVLGYSKDELLRMGPADIDSNLTKEQILNIIRNMPADRIQTFETLHTAKDGTKIPVEISSSLVTYQGKRAILSIARDITERRRLEDALRASEEMFRAISTFASDAILLLDKTDKVIYWNLAAEKIFGYTREEAIGKKLTKLVVPPEHRRAHLKVLKNILEYGKVPEKRLEVPALRKDGTEFPIELTVSALKLKDIPYILEIIRDISERKKIEMKLQEEKKRYRTLFNQAPLGILLIDQTGTAVEFNEETHRQLGYSREEFAKLTVSDYEVLETPAETRARMRKILKIGREEFETKHRTKTGEIRDVVNTVQIIELAGKKFFHAITRDITEQKKIENKLKMERDKLEAVTENVGAGLAIISKDYRILWANNLLKQLNGDCEDKICYSTFNKLANVCPDCGVKKVFERGVPIDIHEYSNLDAKGNRFWVELIVTPIKDENGNVVAALELVVNVTERKILQNKLAEYSQKLEKLVEKRTEQLKQTQAKLVKSERLAAIGELAAMVGHDLRNPLTGIKGAAYYLKTKYSEEIDRAGKMMLKTIDECIEHSNKIINDLLEYSRDLKLELKETNPKTLLAQSMSMLKIPKKIRVVYEAEDNPTIKVDAARMNRVFLNILQNAVDAMPDGGTLTITSKRVKGNLEISVTDTGVGMSKKTLAKLWTPLFTTKAKGMGFGLSICKRIAEAHQGEISVKSKLGEGSTFTVSIPLHPKPAGEAETLVFNGFSLSAATHMPQAS
ncbi:MAG: PAS domain S-box protein [Candidatus Bathyarchaeota archaeon]|nr:PAS domain S-box protein [Candidatus Bathyarchaeota archaeon]